MRNCQKLLLFLLLLSGMLRAEYLGVRAQSLGGAIRAAANSNDIIAYNPAGLLKYRRSGADFDYLMDYLSGDHRLGASLIDSNTTAWGMGLLYNGSTKKGLINGSQLLYLSFAMPIVTEMFCLGASLKYKYSNDSPLHAHYFNMDLGLLANFSYGIGFALVLDNIILNKGNEKPMGFSLASSFDLGKASQEVPLSLSFDWVMNDIKSDGDLAHTLGAGIQYLAASILPLRMGFKSSLYQNQNYMSLGSGIMSDKLSLDLLLQQNLAIGKNRYFGAAIRLYL
jgi:hypothetical protein